MASRTLRPGACRAPAWPCRPRVPGFRRRAWPGRLPAAAFCWPSWASMAAAAAPAAASCCSAAASCAWPASSCVREASSWAWPAASCCSPSVMACPAWSTWAWVANGSTVPRTSGSVSSFFSASVTAARLSSVKPPSGASKTIVAVPPEADGSSFFSLSAMRWVSVPGIWKLLDRVPWKAAAEPPTARSDRQPEREDQPAAAVGEFAEAVEKQCHEGNRSDQEERGSGSRAWRLCRGEAGAQQGHGVDEVAAGVRRGKRRTGRARGALNQTSMAALPQEITEPARART